MQRQFFFRVCHAGILCLVILAAQVRAAGDSFETDNTIGTAKPISFGVTQIHSLHNGGSTITVPPADVDFVTFSLATPSDVVVQTDPDGSVADTLIRLYNGAGVQIALDDDGNPHANRTSRIAASALPVDTYYVSVESFGLQFAAAKRIKSYRLTVVAAPPGTALAPMFTSKTALSAAVGAGVSYVISTIGSEPTTYTASGLPVGLTLSGSTISGVPTTAGTYTITLTASNGTAPDATTTVTLTVVEGGVISTIVGDGKFSYSGDNAPASTSAVNAPAGVAVDGSGALYIADFSNNRIRSVDATTQLIQTLAGTGVSGHTGDGASASAATLKTPGGVAVDASGAVFFADTGNHCVRKISGGTISAVAGTGTPGSGGDGAAATAAQLSSPTALALDAAGNLYIADTGNNCIRKITFGNGFIQTIAGTGTASFSGDGAAATGATLSGPMGVAVDSDGNVYISDTANSRVRKIDIGTGFINTIAGNGTADFSGDGSAALSAEVNLPRGLAVDASGLYIADTDNDRVRRIDFATGLISTAAGDGVNDFNGDGGLAQVASLDSPSGVAEDAAGYLYIADTNNSRVRKVGLATAPTITSASTASGTKGAIFTPYRVTFTGFPAPALTASGLPDGLSLSEGVISGVPAVSGAVDVVIQAQNAVGTAKLNLRLLLAGAAGAANDAPTFTSPPAFITATPNPAVAGATVNFVAPSVGDANGDLLAYTWDFGDPANPATSIGNVASHVYASPGIYTVQLTVTDGVNSIQNSMSLAVNDPSVTQAMILTKAQVKLNFISANKDSLVVSGQIPLRDKFAPNGKVARFFFGNLTRTFTLNTKGTVTSKTDILKLTFKQKIGQFLDTAKVFYSANFTVTLKSQTLANDVAGLGFVKNVSSAIPLTVPVLMSIDGDSYLQQTIFIYSSNDKTGSGTKLNAGAPLPTRSGP